jgi:hypothetical protein
MLDPLVRVKHSLDYEPSIYGDGGRPYRGRQREQKKIGRYVLYVEKPGRQTGDGKLVIWRLTGKYLEYSLVKLTVFQLQGVSFHLIPKGENVPLKCWQRMKV